MTASSVLSTPDTAAPSASTMPALPMASCGESPSPDVGERLPDLRAAEDELDDTIRDLKTIAALAEDAGNIETAKEYTRRLLAASRSRTPEHKDRLAREQLARVEASLNQGCDYFAHQGEVMRRQMEGDQP